MRLIDAEALLACIWDMYHSMENVHDTLSHDYERRMSKAQLGAVLDVVREIHVAPTIEAEPERHGEWVNARKSYYNSYETEVEEQCSLCGRIVYRYDTQPQDFYCPNCGAKMDAKEESPCG